MDLIRVQDSILDKIELWLPFVEVRDIEVQTRESNVAIGANEVRVKILFNIKRDPNTLDSVTMQFTSDTGESPAGGY